MLLDICGNIQGYREFSEYFSKWNFHESNHSSTIWEGLLEIFCLFVCKSIFSQTVQSRKFVKIVSEPISLRVLAVVKVFVKVRWTTGVDGGFYNFEFFSLEKHLLLLPMLDNCSFYNLNRKKIFLLLKFRLHRS